MILTRSAILEEVSFDPKLDVFQIQPHAIDLRIAMDVKLMPGVNVHIATMETVTLPNNVMGVVYPRSSTNRRFIMLDMTGIVDAGYSGRLMLPMTNCTDKPIELKEGERVASIVFHRLEEPVEIKISKYHGSDGAYVPDKEDEAALISSGDIAGLKRRYSL